MANSNLHNAQNEIYDEYYTRLPDIEAELRFYVNDFQGKTVFCNCDDPFESNFTLYFLMNFNYLGLKRLISTGYSTSRIANTRLNKGGTYCLDISDTKSHLQGDQTDLDAEAVLRMLENNDKCISIIEGNGEYLAGDFRSDASLELLKQADIVVGNPPFSMFKEYMAQLQEYKKKFCIIGDINQVSYKEFFPLLKDGKVWMGHTMNGTGSHWFMVPDESHNRGKFKIIDGVRCATNGRACWWTNIDFIERHELMRLGCLYVGHEDNYPKYDNYDAIDIGYTTPAGKRRGDFMLTPYDYEGMMGIPITSLSKFCPEQFEILGIQERDDEFRTRVYTKQEYKKASDMNRAGVIFINDVPVMPYRRIFVKARQPGRNDWDAWQHEIDEQFKGEHQ